MAGISLVDLSVGRVGVTLKVAWWSIGVAAVATGIVISRAVRRSRQGRERWAPVSATVHLGGIGDVTIQPNDEDIQIAHRAWVELATRKATIMFDEEHDVIVEVYDSWYSLFQHMRDLAASVPASLVRNEKSTALLVRLIVDALNDGMRPHLTRWQARFRHWYDKAIQDPRFADEAPQEIQKQFPQYDELVKDLKQMNRGLQEYATAIRMIAHGESVHVSTDDASHA